MCFIFPFLWTNAFPFLRDKRFFLFGGQMVFPFRGTNAFPFLGVKAFLFWGEAFPFFEGQTSFGLQMHIWISLFEVEICLPFEEQMSFVFEAQICAGFPFAKYFFFVWNNYICLCTISILLETHNIPWYVSMIENLVSFGKITLLCMTETSVY